MKAAFLAGFITTLTIGQSPINGQVLPPHSPPGKMIDVGGYRVHLNCVGSGRPTVMILGSGYSFDWSLVQSAVNFAGVCTYDPPGTVWSDAGPAPTCDGRVAEIHKMLDTAGINGPLVLVEHSIGAVFARLYASRYPAEVRGMVLVDHAGRYRIMSGEAAQPGQLGQRITMSTGEESLQKLPSVAQDMHRWAAAQSASGAGSSIPFFDRCIAEVAEMPPAANPSNQMPLIIIADTALAGSANYQRAQNGLLALSRNSKALIARTNSHQVPIEDPAVIVEAIRQVVSAARNQARLK
jgi:pimeloyl-ACP methyl ester carboxylesterase